MPAHHYWRGGDLNVFETPQVGAPGREGREGGAATGAAGAATIATPRKDGPDVKGGEVIR